MKIRVFRKMQPPRYSFVTKRYDRMQFIYVTRGCLHYQGKEQDVAMTVGMFVLLRKNDAFKLFCGKAGYSGVGVAFDSLLPEELKGISFCGVSGSNLRIMMRMLLYHMNIPVPESSYIMRGLGQAVVWEALALERERSAGKKTDWSAAVRTALETAAGAGISAREALKSFSLSYRQLSRYFQRDNGISPKEYMLQFRLNEALHLLTDTQMDITSIAMELGYASSQHFAYQFRKYIGYSPSEYRRIKFKNS